MKKSTLIIFITLIIITLAGGLIGFLESRKPVEPIKTADDYNIKYKYYLDGTEVNEIPKNDELEEGGTEETDDNSTLTPPENTVQDMYAYEKYSCTNRVTGQWDNNKWEFIPNKTSDSTCLIYFVSNYFEVEIKPTNATVNQLEALENRKVKRGEDIVYSLTPTAGYKFDNLSCNNNATAQWNVENSSLTVSNVTKKTTCEISFKIDAFEVEAKANNGTVTEEKTSLNYGESATFTVTPAEGYIYQKVECTNDQKGTWANNKLTITEIKKNTICTVNFTISKHSVTLVLNNGTTSSTNPQQISPEKNASFLISENTGYTSVDPTIECTNGQKGIMSGTLFQVTTVTADTTCTVTLKEVEETE